jgi:hypothetical protein
MKTCPYCLADISDEARKCKFCGEWVEQADHIRETPAHQPALTPTTARDRPRRDPDPRFLRRPNRGGWYDFGEKSFTVGLLGLLLCPPFLLVSILFGVLALSLRDGNHNQNLAVAGMVISTIAILGWTCVLTLAFMH